jgi:DNA-binding NarL/FixJ family response regulator
LCLGANLFNHFPLYAIMTTHVLVVDDHPLIAESLGPALPKNFVVDAALNTDQMHARLRSKSYEVVVLDLELKQGNSGLDFIPALHKAGCKVLVFSGSLDHGHIRHCYAQKVAGVMDKSEPTKNLAKAVIDVADGHRVLPDKILGILTSDKNDFMPVLTHRETEVLNYHFQVPMPSKTEIANAMMLSIGRISNLTTVLCDKLHVADRLQMVTEAKRRGHRASTPLPKKDARQRVTPEK